MYIYKSYIYIHTYKRQFYKRSQVLEACEGLVATQREVEDDTLLARGEEGEGEQGKEVKDPASERRKTQKNSLSLSLSLFLSTAEREERASRGRR